MGIPGNRINDGVGGVKGFWDGIQTFMDRILQDIFCFWIPTFVGMTVEGSGMTVYWEDFGTGYCRGGGFWAAPAGLGFCDG